MSAAVYLALGSNMGDRESYLMDAIKLLNEDPGIEVIKQSSIYETDPVGFTEQSAFLNMAVEIVSSYSPDELLDKTQHIEQCLGRTRKIRWGPRTLDLDILLYNHENIETERLIVPHPRMKERAFVLIPLYEINSHVSIPASQPISVIIDQLSDKEGVRLWKLRNGEGGLEPTES
ncbi:2-amino-4-hydroxy-6-hydroxymethyldihydropteridine diphosphokinase [Bacillus sp. FJAT-42376]|uniref:2-amino-4-hydroxy-6- hydroxymethyldihydropteridine diphosphokinase n=1 Tax=Bacillus sp. FJAT-42376 TaxID=2014076 RepID=UPI000F510890|nr:2-amino-4-hydroxy-6-hydroxymethyldihydropteridine diphosphokinase [Bacillus sp. FJAT-42376]AZB41216.1 2-amino-4-hydroxy-6-hydroxymethyldihydropteridine diphosphokinase [Bacillus sp. FJAT-42376]